MESMIMQFAKSNPASARSIIDGYIQKLTDPNKIAEMEVLREYLTNPEFKGNLENFTFSQQ